MDRRESEVKFVEARTRLDRAFDNLKAKREAEQEVQQDLSTLQQRLDGLLQEKASLLARESDWQAQLVSSSCYSGTPGVYI